jgi:hypothetical protein
MSVKFHICFFSIAIDIETTATSCVGSNTYKGLQCHGFNYCRTPIFLIYHDCQHVQELHKMHLYAVYPMKRKRRNIKSGKLRDRKYFSRATRTKLLKCDAATSCWKPSNFIFFQLCGNYGFPEYRGKLSSPSH